ncbi:MAG: hypothetical protein ACI35P_15860 [Bacillus sp. (in: firmicutes)]
MKTYIPIDGVMDMIEEISEQLKGLEEKIGYAAAIEQQAIIKKKSEVYLHLQRSCREFEQQVELHTIRELPLVNTTLALKLQSKYSY